MKYFVFLFYMHHCGTVLLHMKMNKNKKKGLLVLKWNLSWVDVETAQG